ncbi:acetyltransferase [Gordonia phage Mossy]|nr:acetyltransferase [Gordonia phage Mossy]
MPDVQDFLSHYGVKGMKWGVRKSSSSDSSGSPDLSTRKGRLTALKAREMRNVSVTTKNGETLSLEENKNGKLANRIASLSDKRYAASLNYSDFTIKANGKTIGDASFNKVSDDELNLVWLGVNSSQRGNGYGSAVFDAAVKMGKESGVKKLTLEVPGNAPDARHIYEKRGFKVVKEPSKEDLNDSWGGLTHMALEVDQKSVKHADVVDEESDELELAIDQTYSDLDRTLNRKLGISEDVEHSDVNAFLAHYGVKGMKWGVRKDRPTSATSSNVGVIDPASAIAIGAVATVYGAKGIDAYFQSGKSRSNITRGKKFMTMNSEYWNQRADFASKTYSADDIQKKVVPGINPDYPGSGATMNCRRATLAYEMRRRGYDVQATKTRAGYGQDSGGITKAVGLKGRARRQATANFELTGGGENFIGGGGGKQIFDTLGKQPERSRGELVLQWRGPQPGIPGGAHSVAYEVINGKAHVFDTQSGWKHDATSPIFMNAETAAFTRLDDKDLNKKHLTKWMK